jgi:hypothetical protein
VDGYVSLECEGCGYMGMSVIEWGWMCQSEYGCGLMIMFVGKFISGFFFSEKGCRSGDDMFRSVEMFMCKPGMVVLTVDVFSSENVYV